MNKINKRESSKVTENEDLHPPNRIARNLRGKTLFITGGTGFIGKVLIEKLLRTCPDVKRIYVLIRNKKGINPQDRIHDMFDSPLYDLLRKTRSESVLNKVIAVPGDVVEPDLGLSKYDRRILTEEAEYIFHLAADVQFEGSFKRSILINVRGTKLMIELAKQCQKLKLFVHMSTAYCHLNEKVLYEKSYPAPTDPHNLINLVEFFDESGLQKVKKRLLSGEPNMYTLGKALGETLVTNEFGKFPIVILRVPVVIPIWKDPLPGWINSLNGPIGLFVAAGKGVLRTMYCDPKCYADFLPVDIAANITLAVTCDIFNHEKGVIYNCTSSDKYKITWSDMVEMGRNAIETRIPFNGIMWYPGGSIKRSKVLHWICVVLFHYIPALLLDPFIWLSGNKPVLWRVQMRLTKAFEVFEFFANNQWEFNNDIAKNDKKMLNKTEKAIYDVDGDDLDFDEYLYNCIHGARLYLLKEGDDTLPATKTHMKRLWFLDKFCKTAIMCSLVYFIWIYVFDRILKIFF